MTLCPGGIGEGEEFYYIGTVGSRNTVHRLFPATCPDYSGIGVAAASPSAVGGRNSIFLNICISVENLFGP
ncbi:MAG: hypothetical protein N2747_10455 [Chitinophagaceae bacterium]|nr:hypothetical protein [Chitinophagaceae bacterium]